MREIKNPPTFEEFVLKYGKDIARYVSEYFGGYRVYIPKRQKLEVIERNLFLQKLYAQVPHFSYSDLQVIVEASRNERLSIRQIRRIVDRK